MRVSINNKINIVLFLSIIILTIVLSIYFVNTYSVSMNKELDSRVKSLIENLSSNLLYPVMIRDYDAIINLSENVLDQEDIAFIKITDMTGVSLYEQGEGNIKIFKEYKNEIVLKSDEESDEFMFPGTDSKNNEVIGTIFIKATTERLVKTIDEARNNIAVLASLIIIGAIILNILLINIFIKRPLTLLMTGTRKISKGELEYRVNVKSEDELGDLSHSFNSMASELNLTRNQLVESKDDLERSNKELQEFAYIASHDLQEPLRMVSSYLQLLEQRYKDNLDESANEFIQFAVDGSKRMSDMIQALLLYSRVGSKGEEFEKVDLNEVIDEVLKNLKIAIEESSAEIKHSNLPELFGDKVQLVQLFQNLIGNALKYIEKGKAPVVEVKCEEKEGKWIVSVNDNGIGIDKEYSERVFAIFQRLHSQEYSGAGIGLAVCRKIAERHNGRIWLKSEPGNGSEFFVMFPKKND